MKKIVLVASVLVCVAGVLVTQSRAAQAQSGSQAKPAAKPTMSPDALDRVLAPIALYPDQLLGQMLMCSTNPATVGALNEWLAANRSSGGSELQDAAMKSGFDPSCVALVPFPQIVNTMATQLDRTTQVGQAFTSDRSGVFASIQRLRSKAKAAGTLKTTPQQEVETKTTSSGQQVIVIEPANPQVVYVPQYNPTTVYTQPTTTTVVVQENDNDAAVAAGLIGFTAGIAMGAAMDNNYYYGPYGWHGGFGMYDDAYDDWFDAREDAREDWQDYREDTFEDRSERREDVAEQRGERAGTAQEQRTERSQNRQENRPQSQAEAQQRKTDAQAKASQARTTAESRGYTGENRPAERSGTRSDAVSGYSSGRSERAASSRGQSSRSSSRGGGGRRR